MGKYQESFELALQGIQKVAAEKGKEALQGIQKVAAERGDTDIGEPVFQAFLVILQAAVNIPGNNLLLIYFLYLCMFALGELSAIKS